MRARIFQFNEYRDVDDVHYGRTPEGREFLFVGEYNPEAIHAWNRKKVGVCPLLFESDFSGPADFRRNLLAALKADIDDARMAYVPPPKVEAPVEAGGPPKGRADRAAKA